MPLTSNNVTGTTLAGIGAIISLGGRTFKSSYAPASNFSTALYWDGLDRYGRQMQGGVSGKARVEYSFPLRRVLAPSWARTGNTPIEPSATVFGPAALFREHTFTASRWVAGPSAGLGGWQLDAHHSYDVSTRTLFRGDGTSQSIEAVAQRLTTVASLHPAGFGTGLMAAGPDGSLYFVQASPSLSPRIIKQDVNGGQSAIFFANTISAITAAPNGDLYVMAGPAYYIFQIFRISPSGAVTLIAGNGGGQPALPPPEDVPATSTALRDAKALAVTRDGTVYFAQGGPNNPIVMAVGSDGMLRRVAGNRSPCNCVPNDVNALTTPLPYGVNTVTQGPDDSIYLASAGIVLQLGSDGRLRHVAGQQYGTPPWAIDGGNAKAAELAIGAMTMAPDGYLYLNEGEEGHYHCQLRKVSPDGKIYMLTAGPGDGNCYGSNFADGDISYQVRLRSFAGGIQAGPDGSLYLVRNLSTGYKMLRLNTGYAGIGLSQYVIPDGAELHVFNHDGKHVRTMSAKTGANLRTFGYGPSGHIVSITDGDGNVTTIERDGQGRPSAIVGPYGHRTTLALDADGYLAAITNPASETNTFLYQPGGLLSYMRTPRNFEHFFTYDENGRLTKDEDPAGGSQSLARTGTFADHTVTRTTAEGRIHRYQTENQVLARGKRTRHYLPDGTGTARDELVDGQRAFYTSDGVATYAAESKDPRFQTSATMTTYAQTQMPSGLLRQTWSAASVALSNPADPLTMTSESASVNVNGRTTSSSFVVSSRTQTTTSPAGRTATTVVDSQERPVSITVPGLTPVQVSYDSRGRPQTVTQGTRQYTIAYDASGRPQTVTDPLLRTQSYTYDNADRVLSQTLPDGRQIGFTYDAAGNLSSLTPPGRPAHTFAWTSIDQESLYTPPDLGTGAVATSRAYNLDRQQTRVVRPDGREVDYVYGATTGRLDQMTIARGAYVYGYDTAGRISSIAAPGGATMTFAYDGSLLLGTTWSGSIVGSVTRAYDASFRNTSVSVNGSAISLGYDNDDLLMSAGAMTLARNSQNGLLTGTTLAAVTDTLGYNGFGEVVAYSAQAGVTPLLSFDYGTRDVLGRIAQRTETVLGGSPHAFGYSYDLAGRLSDVTTDSVPTGHYEYDPNGNRTLANGVAATYDAQDRLLTFGTKSYTYTANGELATKTDSATGAVTQYSYDELGNLTRVDLPDGRVVEYVIDGLNRRVAKKVDGVVVAKWLWQSQLRIAAELDASNNVVSRFVYATKANVPDYLVKAGVTYKILTDQVGTPRLVVRADTGAEVQRTSRDEFGVLIAESGDTTLHPFGFAGGLFDRDTGLVRFGARDYDAETGRWTAKDPIRFAGGLTSLYSYVGSDPVNNMDPNGLDLFGRRQLPPQMTAKARSECGCAPAPKGVDAYQNLRQAWNNRFPFWRWPWFYNQVKAGGPWDYKSFINTPDAEVFGNFNFGATGFVLDFHSQTLLRLAGWAQQSGDDPNYPGSWYGSSPYGDDPRDQLQIWRGYEWGRCVYENSF